MQHSLKLSLLGSLVALSACSSTPERDNPKLSRQSDTLAIPYSQDWETGGADWSSAQGEAVTLASDPTSDSGSAVQQLDRVTFGGDFFSPYLPVVGGQTYCVRAKIKWVSGAAPFVGIERSSGNEWLGISWLFGSAYKDAHGSTQAISSTESGWQNLFRSVLVLAGTTRIRVTDELYLNSTKDGPNLSYIDSVSVTNGACVIYSQDWEAGTGAWLDNAGQSPTLATDDTSTAGTTVQRLERATFGGDYSSPYMPVVGGQRYCVSARIRWLGGAAPFVGIEKSDGNGSLGINWLFGTAYTDAHGSTQAISSTETGWQNLSRSVSIPTGTTQIRLTNELYVDSVKDGPPLGYFDGLSIAEGACDWQIKTIAVGASHGCALTSLGGVRCWGDNKYGQLGDNTNASRSSASTRDVLVGVQALALGDAHTCALMSGGGVRCWGDNAFGQLGDGSTTPRPTPPTSDVLTGATAITAGSVHTCALMSGGGVRCWGYNAFGQLGDGTTATRTTPPATDVLTGAKAIAANGQRTCALMDSGGVRCWGDARFGQLGDGTTTNRITPPTSDVLTGVKGIATGTYHTCALIESGGVRCWGWNQYGQLGDNTSTTRSTPTSDILDGVKAIAAGGAHTCALMESNGLRCWGYNTFGQLGNGTTITQWRPDTFDSRALPEVLAVAAKSNQSCALVSSSDIRCWGSITRDAGDAGYWVLVKVIDP